MKSKTIGEYRLVRFLGKGSYGEIYLAQKGNDPTLYAAKVLDKQRMEKPTMKKYLEREISILKQLKHPNICQFYDKLVDESHIYLIIEFCNGGNLTQCMGKYISVYKEPFSIEIIQHFMRQIISAFCHIHSNKIIHRDIKLDNILLSFKDPKDIKKLNLLRSEIKIIDFGVATKLDESEFAFTAVGSPITMDPLILKKYLNAGGIEKLQGYNEKADVWSLGTIFYQLLTGQGMFKFNTMEEFMKRVDEGTYVVPINKNFSKEAISFLNCMLQYNPEDRISVHNLAQHVFITNNASTFTQADLQSIFHKIDKNGLVLNIKGDETIVSAFNVAKRNSNQFKDIGQNVPNKKRSLNRANTYEDEGYSFTASIYDTVEEDNPKSSDNVNNNFNNDKKNQRRVGGANLLNQNQIDELTKFQEELKENERIEKENEEKKRIEREKQEKEQKEKETLRLDKANINEKEEIGLYIKGLLDEYKAAREYFQKNGLTTQEQNANGRYEYLEKILKMYEQGNQINFESLPKPITPEYIYNCTGEKRNSIFKEAIDKLTEKKEELEMSLKKAILKYQSLDRESFSIIKNEVMSKLQNEKIRIEKYKQILELIKDKFNNIWTPPPELSRDIEVGTFEKISFEGCIFKLIIHTTKTNYYNSSNNFIIRLTMKINENKTFYGDIKIFNFGDFEDAIIWNLNQNEWNNLSNYFINVDFFLDQTYKGNQKININKLKEEKKLVLNYPISFLNQPSNAIINFSMKVIMPEGKKIVTKGSRETINIKKQYPAFEGKSPYTFEIPKVFLEQKE